MINLLIPNFEFWDRNHGYLEIASCQSESLMRYPFLTTGRKTPQISCEKEQQKVPRKSDPWITPVIWFCTALGSYQSSRGCSWSLVTYSFVYTLVMQKISLSTNRIFDAARPIPLPSEIGQVQDRNCLTPLTFGTDMASGIGKCHSNSIAALRAVKRTLCQMCGLQLRKKCLSS